MIIITCVGGCRREDGHRRIWRELCPDCARDTAERHHTETGHHIHIQRSITAAGLAVDVKEGRTHV